MSAIDPLELLLPAGVRPLAVPGVRPDQVRAACVHGPVALLARRPGSRQRLRRVAERAGVRVRAEYVVLPTLARPLVALADDRDTGRWVAGHLLGVPPGRYGWSARLLSLVLASARSGVIAPLVRAAAPGRITVVEALQ